MLLQPYCDPGRPGPGTISTMPPEKQRARLLTGRANSAQPSCQSSFSASRQRWVRREATSFAEMALVSSTVAP